MTAERRPDRTYAVPFDHVWRIALSLAGGNLQGWTLVEADDRRGVIAARREAMLLRPAVELRIGIGLDENAQTRVELDARGVDGRGAPRAGRRAVAHFLERLDAEVGRAAGAVRTPTWSS